MTPYTSPYVPANVSTTPASLHASPFPVPLPSKLSRPPHSPTRFGLRACHPPHRPLGGHARPRGGPHRGGLIYSASGVPSTLTPFAHRSLPAHLHPRPYPPATTTTPSLPLPPSGSGMQTPLAVELSSSKGSYVSDRNPRSGCRRW